MTEQPNQESSAAHAPASSKFLDSSTVWLFAGLSFLSVLPFWTIRYPVICDYPNHLASWFVLFHANDPAFHFSSYYTPAWGPLPYISTDLLAVALQCIFPIGIVGRLILTICVLSVPLATLFFLKKACPQNAPLAIFAILVSFNPNFLMGSLSNQISIGLCMIAVGLWIDYCRRARALTAVLLVLTLLFLYLSHLIGFAIAGLVMGVYALFQQGWVKKLAILAAVSLPALLLLVYNQRHAGAGGYVVYGGLSAWDKLRNLAFPIRLDSKKLDLIILCGLAAVVVLLIVHRRYLKPQKLWITMFIILTVAYLAAPGEYRLGGYFDVRIMPFLYLFVLASVAVQKIPRSVIAILALLVVFRVATVERMFYSNQPELRSLSAAFEAIPRDARVLPIVSQQQYAKSTLVGHGDPHHWGYGVVQRGFLVPTIFHIPGVQPIQIPATAYCPNPLCNFGDPGDVNWREISQDYDYIWLEKYPSLELAAANWGEPVFHNDVLTVFRVRH